VNNITIGEQSTIGDKAVVHAAKIKNDIPTVIGSRVTVGK
jgi:carbonic anhydrase/acetyltransferase-like protein (isoleucine patch superfamily)